MFRLPMVLGACLLGFAVLVGGGVSQEKTDPKPPDTKKKGQLPPGWKKLGLSADQVQKIYALQSDYKSKIKKLEEEIKDLKSKEHQEMVKVLTDTQKAELVKGLIDDKKASPKDDKKETK